MAKYLCEPCGYVYDPEIGDPDNGIEPETEFDELPEDWECPICGAYKEDFTEID
jgi:rubredoxin